MKCKIMFACLFLLLQIDLRAQTKICMYAERIGSHESSLDGYSYSFNVKTAPGAFGWYVTNLDNLMVYHFKAYSEGLYEIELVKKGIFGIVFSREIYERYVTWGPETYSSPVTTTFEGKGKIVDLLPGFDADSKNGVANIFFVDCSSFLRDDFLFDGNNAEESNESNLNETKLSVYPNPVTSGKVYFGKIEEYFQVFDATGALIKSGTNSDGIEVSGFPKGIYIIVRSGKTEKLIVE